MIGEFASSMVIGVPGREVLDTFRGGRIYMGNPDRDSGAEAIPDRGRRVHRLSCGGKSASVCKRAVGEYNSCYFRLCGA